MGWGELTESSFEVTVGDTVYEQRIMRFDDGKVIRAYFTDVTDLKRTEKEARVAKEQAEAASLSKSEFLASMSHEIRTPMNGVVGVKIAVSDTGIGVPASAQESIFESFSQADSSTTRKFGGTGLGLAICRQLSEMMGGSIGVDSVEGEGATFWCTVELRRLELEREASFSAEADLEGVRILIVDDNDLVRKMTARTLAKFGAEAEECCSGHQCLSLVGRRARDGKPYDVILLDVLMEGLNGEETARGLRASPFGEEVPIVFLSGIGDQIPSEKLEGLRIRHQLRKPARVSQLVGTIRELATHGAPLVGGAESPRTWAGGSPVEQDLVAMAETGFRRALVVDDNLINRRVAKKLLEKSGFEVELAEDGEQGVAAFSAGQYDVVLMDVEMPVLNGFGATAKIREYESENGVAPHAVVLGVSASVSVEDRERCSRSGMNGFLPKPFKRRHLHAALEPLKIERLQRLQSAEPAEAAPDGLPS